MQSPTVPPEYSPDNALDDLPAIKHACYLFLNSNMVESEEYCLKCDPKKERLYITSGYSLIQCLKALMSYELEDLQEANKHVKHGNALAGQYRAPSPPLVSRIAGLVWENSSSGVGFIKNMTQLQRHAELLYAETLFAKAMLGVVTSGSWLSFLTEAFNFRSMINTYLQLGKYLETVDSEAAARGEVGASNLILSLMPDRLISVAEVFGYRGDRSAGLALLMKAGGWVTGERLPAVSVEKEGLRRVLADICLLCFHLVISGVTYRGVDLELAESILNWNIERFPNGVFFLAALGRLSLLRSQPSKALMYYTRAFEAQNEYRSLHFLVFWERAHAYMASWDLRSAIVEWRALIDGGATWSRATYVYGTAACLLQLATTEETEERADKDRAEAAELLARVPGLVHKIAGRSVPIEKFVSRKARKYVLQDKRLCLPAMELAYMMQALGHASRRAIQECHLPVAQAAAINISAKVHKSSANESRGKGFWDDFCLAHLLEGVCWRLIAYPTPEARVSSEETTPEKENPKYAQRQAAQSAKSSLEQCIRQGSKIELDHWMIYYAHYELGRLLVCMGQTSEARRHLNLVLCGKPLEEDPHSRKGKYSMQSELMLRTSAALEALDSEQ